MQVREDDLFAEGPGTPTARAVAAAKAYLGGLDAARRQSDWASRPLAARNRATTEHARALDEHHRLAQAWESAGSPRDPAPRCDRCGAKGTGADGLCRSCDPPPTGERDERTRAWR